MCAIVPLLHGASPSGWAQMPTSIGRRKFLAAFVGVKHPGAGARLQLDLKQPVPRDDVAERTVRVRFRRGEDVRHIAGVIPHLDAGAEPWNPPTRDPRQLRTPGDRPDAIERIERRPNRGRGPDLQHTGGNTHRKHHQCSHSAQGRPPPDRYDRNSGVHGTNNVLGPDRRRPAPHVPGTDRR